MNSSLVLVLFTFATISLATASSQSGPNIIFILIDDVGWADFGYNNKIDILGNKESISRGNIPTPKIDNLAEKGLKLTSHYVHPTCTPSRSSLMTGRYSFHTGQTFASLHGSVNGLPEDMPTMPQLLRKAGYSAHMVGKWHLGHAKPKLGPVGRGFQSHTGSFLWSLNSYTKVVHGGKGPYGVDWITEYENGTYLHSAEPRHATIAITETSIQRMKEHKSNRKENNPLFLYLSYNAAHSPCQSEPEWETVCTHIPHLWRRQFCGMVVGLDHAIEKIAKEALDILGEDTVIVVSSDNGGSVWFGGMNAPFRSGKLNPFEGGVRVPAFAIDLSKGKKYLGKEGREFKNIMHISDWLPTFLSWSKSDHLVKNIEFDGIDQSKALKESEADPVRNDVLIDLFTEAHDGSSMMAYRKGKYKVIQGYIRDPHWYFEPTEDKMNTTDDGIIVRVIENIVRSWDWLFGHTENDYWRLWLSNYLLFQTYSKKGGLQTLLFDIDNDPRETNNIADKNPEIVRELLSEVKEYTRNKPKASPYWMVTKDWSTTFIPGNCTEQKDLPENLCKFTHYWYPDSTDLLDDKSMNLENGIEIGVKAVILFWIKGFAATVLGSIVIINVILKIRNKKTKLKSN